MAEESLFDWVEPVKKEKLRQKRYISKHDPNPLLVSSSFCPSRITKDPTRKTKIRIKPPVPKREDAPPSGTTTKKNFVMANAIQTILSTPVENHNKTDKRYVNRPDYGKVPEYLKKIKSEREEEEREVIKSYEAETKKRMVAMGYSSESRMPEEQRIELLQKLKIKWDECNNLYQKQAHLIILDTQGKVKRKEVLENKLKEIENAIRRLEKGPVIIVHQE